MGFYGLFINILFHQYPFQILHSVKNIKLYLSFEFTTYASGSKGVLLWNNVIALLLMKPSQVISIF